MLRVCEKLVHILIDDEPEQGLENLQEVSIPPNILAQLSKLDQLNSDDS